MDFFHCFKLNFMCFTEFTHPVLLFLELLPSRVYEIEIVHHQIGEEDQIRFLADPIRSPLLRFSKRVPLNSALFPLLLFF